MAALVLGLEVAHRELAEQVAVAIEGPHKPDRAEALEESVGGAGVHRARSNAIVGISQRFKVKSEVAADRALRRRFLSAV